LGDGGWGIGDWGLGPIPKPHTPIPNPQSPVKILLKNNNNDLKIILLFNLI